MISDINSYLSQRRYLVVSTLVIITAIMLYLTLSPVEDLIPSPIWSWDKLGHFLMFGSWTFLIGYYWFLSRPGSLNHIAIFVIGVLFGIAIELLQYYMPFHRDAEVYDVLFDALGCLLATLSLYQVTERHP